jgi:hypothetical protein
MKRSLAFFGAVFVLILVCPGAGAEPPDKPDSRPMEDLEREVRDLKRDVAELRRLRAIESKLLAAEMRLLAERLDRIERTLSRLAPMNGPPPGGTRVASSFTPTLPSAATGTIRLTNGLEVTAVVTVNGITYTVPPFSSRLLLGQPAGSFVYEAFADTWGRTLPIRSFLGTNETVTLTLHR